MKKKYLYMLLVFMPMLMTGQVNELDQINKQTTQGNQLVPDSLKSLIPISKQSLLRDVDVIFNSRMAYNSDFVDGGHTLSAFNIDQLRLEIKGKIHDKVYFRFRDRYTRSQDPGDLDNISRSVDLAFISIDLSERAKFSFGKLCN